MLLEAALVVVGVCLLKLTVFRVGGALVVGVVLGEFVLLLLSLPLLLLSRFLLFRASVTYFCLVGVWVLDDLVVSLSSSSVSSSVISAGF